METALPTDTPTALVEQHTLTTMPSAQSWVSQHLTALIVLGLTAAVVWLALRGDRDAIVALMGSYTTLIGVQFGSRVALKIPGKDS